MTNSLPSEGPDQERSKSDVGFWLVVLALFFLGYHLLQKAPNSLKKGTKAPPLELIRLANGVQTLESWKGQISVLHFWATW